MELAKTRMQTQGQGEKITLLKDGGKPNGSLLYTGPWDCLRKIYKAEGIVGVNRGMVLTLIREVPSFGVYFVVYEYICRKFDTKKDVPLSTSVLLFAGGIAGQLSWLSTYPADVVKSRIQNDVANEYSSAMDCVRKSYAQEGYRCFFRGLNATLIRAFPMNGATFATVAWIFRMADKQQPVDDDPAIKLSHLSGYERNEWRHRVHVHHHDIQPFGIHP